MLRAARTLITSSCVGPRANMRSRRSSRRKRVAPITSARPLCSQSSMGCMAGRCTSCAPERSISSRMMFSILRKTRQPTGVNEYSPAARGEMSPARRSSLWLGISASAGASRRVFRSSLLIRMCSNRQDAEGAKSERSEGKRWRRRESGSSTIAPVADSPGTDSRSAPPRGVEIAGVEDEGHRAVIGEVDVHVLAEGAAVTGDPGGFDGGAERVIEWQCGVAGRGCVERGPAAAADVAVQRELADAEDLAANIGKAEVHTPFGILEDAQAGHLRRELPGHGGRVVGCYPDEHQESPRDVRDLTALGGNAGARDSLDDRAHGLLLGAVAAEG